MLNLEKLKQSFEKIKKIGYQEEEVEISGEKIVLGVISAEEEVMMHEYSGRFEKMSYAFQFKIETLAYAIRQIGDNDFRNVDFVEDKDEKGEVVRKERHVFLREFVGGLGEGLVDMLFDRYRALADKVRTSVEAQLKFEENVEPEEKKEEVDLREKHVFKEVSDIAGAMDQGILDQGPQGAETIV